MQRVFKQYLPSVMQAGNIEEGTTTGDGMLMTGQQPARLAPARRLFVPTTQRRLERRILRPSSYRRFSRFLAPVADGVHLPNVSAETVRAVRIAK